MITLAKHIEYLLLDNDCVIVPDLGGFIAHYQAAYYDKNAFTFCPPKRVIGFNPKLVMNDGLLVQSYMQFFQTDFSDANKRIQEEVDRIKNKLYDDGKVDIPGIGTLSCDINNDYKFIPSTDSISSPFLYGLSEFEFSKFDNKKKRPIQKKAEYTIPQPQRSVDRNIGYKCAAGVVAVAIAFVMFFFLSVPVENSYVESNSYAYLGDAGLFNSIRSKSFATAIINNVNTNKEKPALQDKNSNSKCDNKSKAEVVMKEVASKTGNTILQKKQLESVKHEKNEPVKSDLIVKDKNFHVIIATLYSQKAAEKALELYKNKGYNDVTIIKGSSVYRLSIGDYENKSSAYNKMNELRSKSEFSDSWILCSK